VTAAAGSSTDAAIEIRGLVKRYEGRAVVDGIDLTVGRGEVFALLGPNGAGKTTTVEIVEGYRRADAGTVRVLGLDPAHDAATVRARIGLMLQDGGVYRQARPREMLRLFGAFYRDPVPAGELLRLVGLEDAARRSWRVLSGGQRQRLGLALALVGRPQLVVLDEPTAGMDPAARVATRSLIDGLRRDGVTVLLTTHDLADVEALADRVAIVVRGRIVAEGTPTSLGTDGAASPVLSVRFGRALTADEQSAFRTAFPDALAGATVDRASLPTDKRDGASLLAAVTGWSASQGIPIAETRAGGGSLEERYLALVADGDTV
jgi:ABC-2 type transport system ATP-binding protein